MVSSRCELVVIARPPHVFVHGQLKSQRLGRARDPQIPAALQDGFHALTRGTGQAQSQPARRFQALLAVLAGQGQKSQTRSIALLGMRLRAQQVLDDCPGVYPDRLAPLDQAFRSPLGMCPV